MKSSDELFLLIKSLSRQEKGYFKKFASAFADTENSNYISLFDEIVSQCAASDIYDEEKIKKKSFSGKFVKNLSFHKNYLYNMILASLVMYNREKSADINLRFMIAQIKILYDKQLFDQSHKLLTKAKKIAEDGSDYSGLNSLLALEKIVSKKILNNSDFRERFEKISLKQKENILHLSNTLDYSIIYTQIGIHTERGGTGLARNSDESSAFESIFKDSLIQNEKNALTFQSKYYLYNTRLQYYMSINKYDKAYEESQKIVKLMESRPEILRKDIHKYIVALNNHLAIQCRVSSYHEREETISKMLELNVKFGNLIAESDKTLMFYSTSVMKISSLFEHLDEDILRKHLNNVYKDFPLYEKKLPLQMLIIVYYFLGVSNFVLGDFDKCIHWMGKIINGEKSDHSQDYQCYSRIVYLLSYYELEYFDSLEYVLKSAYRFLSNKNRVYKYENIILNYLRRSFRIRSKSELDEMFIDMKNELMKIQNDEFEKNAFDAFNILYWLEGKITKRSLIDIMKEKQA